MLIHHFEAETQGFQGLVDQNDRGKAYVPEKSHFLKETFFSGGPKIDEIGGCACIVLYFLDI